MLHLALALLATAPGFDAAKKDAVVLEHPQNAVLVVVGACDAGGGAVNGECLENTKDLKDKVTGKKLFLDLGSGYDQLLSFGGRTGGKARFVWAPLYDVGNGLALTVGKPQKISSNGNVVMQKRPVDGTSPDELSDLDLQRIAGTGMVGIRVVGKFGKTWQMSGPGGKPVKGVLFEVEALQLYNARSGAVIFESTQSLK
ncbi:MAG TPA: DUF6066 family protein [Myxococcota bacterium]|jgi:hypothetical protein